MAKDVSLAKFALRLPLSMRRQLIELAKSEGISLNQFITLAIAEKIVRLELTTANAEPDRLAIYPLIEDKATSEPYPF